MKISNPGFHRYKIRKPEYAYMRQKDSRGLFIAPRYCAFPGFEYVYKETGNIEIRVNEPWRYSLRYINFQYLHMVIMGHVRLYFQKMQAFLSDYWLILKTAQLSK